MEVATYTYTFESCYFSKINLTFTHIANLNFNISKVAFFCFISFHLLVQFEQSYFIYTFYCKSPQVLTKNYTAGLFRQRMAWGFQQHWGCLQEMGPPRKCEPSVLFLTKTGIPREQESVLMWKLGRGGGQFSGSQQQVWRRPEKYQGAREST